MQHPVNNVEWVEVDSLTINNYNPNHVMGAELRLLEKSLLVQGWIQPILVSKDNVIIDGFHRASLTKTSTKLQKAFGSKIPICVLDIPEHEAIMLTVRINRAKGSHAAFKMSDIVTKLINEFDLSDKEMMEGMGMNKEELGILKGANVFKVLDIANHKFTDAWYPEKKIVKSPDFGKTKSN